MIKGVGNIFTGAIVTVLLSFVGTSAHAQSNLHAQVATRLELATKRIESACHDDLAKYCSMVTPGEGRSILCLEAFEDKVSASCDYAIFEASRNLEGVLNRIEHTAELCWRDMEQYCAHMPDGGGQLVHCLVDKEKSLSPLCQSAISSLPK